MGMTDSGAVIGLIGAVGGAVVGGAAGVYGPLLLKRQERRDLEADRTLESLIADRDMAAEVRVERLAILTVARVKTRLWYDFLSQTANRASAGEPLDTQAFTAEQDRLSEEAMGACYALSAIRVSAGRDSHGVLKSLRHASEVIYEALRRGEFHGAPMPSSVVDALEAVASARSWFRLTADRLVEEIPQ